MPKRPYRHGDVLLIPLDDDEPVTGTLVPVEREDVGVVLAHGEATGHRHAIADEQATLSQIMLGTTVHTVGNPSSERLLRLPRPATLRQTSPNPAEVEGVHLHGPIKLPAGRYLVRIQRQLEPGRGASYVTD